MSYYIKADEICLRDGTVIHKNDRGEFPPYSKISDTGEPCKVCPVRLMCDDNNSFDCDTYSMFQGAYFSFDAVLKFCNELVEVANA